MTYFQRDINKIKDKAVKTAKEVNSEEIFRLAGFPLVKRGNQTYTNCPSCGATAKERKCSISKKGQWYCFGCTTGGGSPQAHHLIHGTTWLESCVIIAYKCGSITAEEYDAVMGGSAVAREKLNSDSITYQEIDRASSELAEVKAPPEDVDMVYRHLLALPSLRLNQKGYTHLVKKRGLSDKEIKEEGYFSYDKPFSMKELVESIRRERPDFKPEQFKGIPGFYFLKKDEKRGWWVFNFPYPDCLGIPLRDSYGRIVALQMRNLEARKKDAKYFYISSLDKEDRRGKTQYGSSPGTPVAVTLPEKILAPVCFIGEGHFKMREIAKEGVISMSIQGINSYKYLADEIKDMMNCPVLVSKTEGLKERVLKFCIVFDADMYRKNEVVSAALNIGQYLRKNFGYDRDVSYLIWNPSLGKGFDDFKAECIRRGVPYQENCTRIDYGTFSKMVREALDEADREYVSKHPEKEKKMFRVEDEWKNYLFTHLYEEKISKLIPR